MLINWGGHNNLGDDAMVRIIKKYIPESDTWDIFGGGTLIQPYGEFGAAIRNPERTIGISLGVSSEWKGENAELFRRFHKLYVRDYYSHMKLKEYNVPSILSVDLLTELQTTKKNKGLFANVCELTTEQFEYHNVISAMIAERDMEYFAMSPDHDKGPVFTDEQVLLDKIAGADVVATRLHANVIAWVGGCRITPIVYDPKIIHFYQRVAGMTPAEARKIIVGHLKEIASCVSAS